MPSNASAGVPAIAQATWFDANGNVIKHTTTRLDLFIAVHRNGAGPPRGGQHRQSAP